MKPFKLLTDNEQIDRYIKTLERAHEHSKQNIREKHQRLFEKQQKMSDSINRLEWRIDCLFDQVADEADRVYGGWEKWRHSPRLLKRVFKQMEEKAQVLLSKRDALEKQRSRVLKPYNDEVGALASWTVQKIQEMQSLKK